MSLSYEVVKEAYAAMGRPNMPEMDDGVQYWMHYGNDAREIWEAAATMIDDPEWGAVARTASALLAVANATNTGTVLTTTGGASKVLDWVKTSPYALPMIAVTAYMLFRKK